jgi:hypothetical protein
LQKPHREANQKGEMFGLPKRLFFNHITNKNNITQAQKKKTKELNLK